MHACVRRLFILCSAAIGLAACGHESPIGHAALPHASSERPAEDELGAEQALRKAEALRTRGELVEALSLLASAHRRFPNDARVTSAYGRVALLLGHDALAAPLLKQAVAADPRDWRAFSAQGVLDSRKGRLPDGRRALLQANSISASEAITLNNLAISHLLANEPQEAASLLRQALASPELKPPHESRLKRNLALALAVQGRFHEAESLAGEKLPRELAGPDPAVLRGLLGLSEARLEPADGWKARVAAASEPARPAWQ